MKQSHKKRKLRLWVWITIITISIILLLLSCYQIIIWKADNQKIKKQVKEIERITVVKEIPTNIETEKLVNPPQENKKDDYWDYIQLPLIAVDFRELSKKNNDTVAFIKVNGTNINYPVVQTNDNKFYLNHSFDKTKNSAGWVFLDYRNDINNLQDNTIIYAHGRTNTTMFGSLKNVFKSNWYQNTKNYIVHISTPTQNTLWQVFSVYHIPTETYYLTSNFGSKESHQKFIDTIIKRSRYNFNTEVNCDDKILTLSTCYNNNEKVVLHAKLIKQQKNI